MHRGGVGARGLKGLFWPLRICAQVCSPGPAASSLQGSWAGSADASITQAGMPPFNNLSLPCLCWAPAFLSSPCRSGPHTVATPQLVRQMRCFLEERYARFAFAFDLATATASPAAAELPAGPALARKEPTKKEQREQSKVDKQSSGAWTAAGDELVVGMHDCTHTKLT